MLLIFKGSREGTEILKETQVSSRQQWTGYRDRTMQFANHAVGIDMKNGGYSVIKNRTTGVKQNGHIVDLPDFIKDLTCEILRFRDDIE